MPSAGTTTLSALANPLAPRPNHAREDFPMFRTLMIGAVSALTLSAAALKASDSFAQGSALKDQLVGTWTMVSNVNTRPDGTKYEALGRNPRGVFVLDANGRFVIAIIGEGRLAPIDLDAI